MGRRDRFEAWEDRQRVLEILFPIALLAVPVLVLLLAPLDLTSGAGPSSPDEGATGPALTTTPQRAAAAEPTDGRSWSATSSPPPSDASARWLGASIAATATGLDSPAGAIIGGDSTSEPPPTGSTASPPPAGQTPSPSASDTPAEEPTQEPTPEPTPEPTQEPTPEPTPEPTDEGVILLSDPIRSLRPTPLL